MKYVKTITTNGTTSYKLYKRKYMVIDLEDDFIQPLGSITGNYEKAIGYAYRFILSFLEKDDKPIMEPIKYSDYNVGEYIRVINPANDNHAEIIYDIHILYIDTFIKDIDDIDKYKVKHGEKFVMVYEKE